MGARALAGAGQRTQTLQAMRLGIDVGGTFTDVVGLGEDGRVTVRKAHTTPQDPTQGVLAGIAKVLGALGSHSDEVRLVVHGTTIATNALLERKGARTGLLTTAGFRDVAEIGRVQRPAAGLYDFSVDNPEPLVPRALRLEAIERVGSRGDVVTPLDEQSLRRAAEVFRGERVEAVAVCFLFSFLMPDHERRARDVLAKELPGVFVSLSSDVCPEFREYERTSTTVLSAYLQPVVESYVHRLSRRLAETHPGADLRLVQANGGAMRAAGAQGRSVHLVNSGPAGGATAAAYLARALHEPNIVAVDMGGTSFDISLILGGLPHVSTESKFDGFPIRIAMNDVSVIGAGGGSIAWIDKGGALRVGPRSAGAAPGPACYGQGGSDPTVTDANLALGRISPGYFLGGEVPLREELARESIRARVAAPLGLSLDEAAAGILRVVNANMAKGISAKTVKQGHDLREFTLVAFGGAGPLHAVDLALELGMKRVVIPPLPGALSAFGLLCADTRYDFTRTVMKADAQIDPAWLARTFLDLERQGEAELEAERIPADRRRILWSADLRFEGQSYELNVPVERGSLGDADVRAMLDAFARLHERIYAFAAVDERTVLVNLRVTALGLAPRLDLPPPPPGAGAAHAEKGRRPVSFASLGAVPARVYERGRLGVGDVVPGPAVVEEEISCTVIPPDREGRVDRLGNLVVDLGGSP
jgi:N-methylhydantoinase A